MDNDRPIVDAAGQPLPSTDPESQEEQAVPAGVSTPAEPTNDEPQVPITAAASEGNPEQAAGGQEKAQVGYVAAMLQDGRMHFETFGEVLNAVTLLGIHQIAGARIDNIAHEVGTGASLSKLHMKLEQFEQQLGHIARIADVMVNLLTRLPGGPPTPNQ